MRSHYEDDIVLELGQHLSPQGEPARLDYDALRHHLFIVGQTGSGKTTLLRNLAIQLIDRGCGVSIIDPHGDVSEELLRLIPPARFSEVVYLDAGDDEFAVALDWFGRSLPRDRREPVASALVAAFKGYFGDSWGPRLEMILSASLMALLECEAESLMGLPRLLDDERYRDRVLTQVQNPMVRSFFENQFGSWDKRQRAEFVGPVLNKVSRLFLNASMRSLFGQVKARANLRFMMDHRRLLIVNCAKGRIGEDSAALLGSMLVALFEQSAYSRADITETERVPHVLMVDEFHNFATQRFATAFSELRKYGLSIVALGQYLQQSAPEIQNAIFGNCGTLIAMRTSAADAEVLRKQMADESKGLDWFRDLAQYEAVVRRMTHIENPRKILTHPPMESQMHDGESLRRQSREKYGVPKRVIEEKIGRWLRS